MFAEYTLLAIVLVILLIAKIVADRQQELQRWFYYYEQKKITIPYRSQSTPGRRFRPLIKTHFPPQARSHI
jgi:hypothetical protein